MDIPAYSKTIATDVKTEIDSHLAKEASGVKGFLHSHVGLCMVIAGVLLAGIVIGYELGKTHVH